MQAIKFNDDWKYRRIDTAEEKEFVGVTLPHDAMLVEGRSEDSLGEHNISFFIGGDYEYIKEFDAPADWADKDVYFEFEGVYRNAEVYINGEKVMYRPYGYINFVVPATDNIKAGEKNELKVIARNSAQPNSRWYSGSGIYRDVNLYVADKRHIEIAGVRVTTLSLMPPKVKFEVKTTDNSSSHVEIFSPEGEIIGIGDTENGEVILDIPAPLHYWSPSSPVLYTYEVTCGTDKDSGHFGLRTIEWNAENGLMLNGERIVLNGACIHHDNGILGACAYKSAEERKVRLLKETGYNAIRSAHNPCSKALLDACDRLGMLVMDEYVDMWYIHKTEYDYADYHADWWDKDLKDMVDKDYNHPSVIMYSTGNEVSETAQPRGIELTGKMTEYLHSLDSTRPVSCGVNIFFNFLSSMGFGVYSDKKAKKNLEKAKAKEAQAKKAPGKKKKKVGSEFFNTLAGFFGDKVMKMGATLHGCDVKTRDAFANMDVAGYNYGILRYKHDLKKYPERLILGSETFCKDTYDFTVLAAENSRVVGDFVWAGVDYLGESGIGAWEYKEYAPTFVNGYGWVTAGSGRLDITGVGGGEAAYTRVMFGVEKLAFAVVPVSTANQKHSPSAWKMTNAKESWSWEGYDGKKTTVEVYSRDFKVSLFINSRKVGTKKVKHGRAMFKTKYRDGEALVIAYDENGKETARKSMATAGGQTVLSLTPEKKQIAKDELAFVQIAYTDDSGEVKPLARGDVSVSVEGGELLGLGSGCSYTERSYITDVTDTYYGRALAVIKPTSDEIKVTASSIYGGATARVVAE